VKEKSLVPVLIVDDNAAKRLALKAILLPLGYSIVEADSGRAALRCVMAQDFAVILLDVRMPNMDGFETARLIRERRQSEMTPIIFITAYATEEIVPIARYVQGAVDFMFAPVIPDELRAKVSVFANLFIKAEVLAARAGEVQRYADQLKLLSDAAPIGVFHTDAENRFVYTNPRWTEITGISFAEAVGRDWATIIGSGVRAGLVTELADGAGDSSQLSHRFEIRTPGSPSRIVMITSERIPETEAGMVGFVGILADVTSEAGAEAAMSDARDKATEASQLKSDFLANMSHEIRTPMNGVIGMTDLLLETDLDDRQRDYAETVRTSGEALLTIIDHILDFSRVEAGKLEIEDIEFSPGSIVEGVVDLLEGPAQIKGLKLSASIDDSLPAFVSGDPGRVRQVLINLIGNAIKFTQVGEISIRALETEHIDDESVIRFEVSDSGVGIAPDKIAVIFHPFVQADTSTSRKYGGTGLGLAISGQLVSLMGGDCGVSSRLGEGSDFWFTIRVHVQTEPSQFDRPSPNEAEPTSTRPRSVRQGASGHILVAEDNPVNQLVASAMLESLGYSVDLVADGAEVVKVANSKRYDAILMDCQMPVLDGYEASTEIRRMHGDSHRTPIIAVTASAMASDKKRCLAAGMDDYLTKPLTLRALATMLARWAPVGSDVSESVDSLESEPGDEVEKLEPPATRAALDPEVVDRLVRMGKSSGDDLMGQLTTLFLEDADIRLDALRKGLAGEDASAVTRSAHILGGASANLGARSLADMCAGLATKSATGDLDGGSELLDELETELGRVRLALDLSAATP
jgi:PAS domain S-box-containing protein